MVRFSDFTVIVIFESSFFNSILKYLQKEQSKTIIFIDTCNFHLYLPKPVFNHFVFKLKNIHNLIVTEIAVKSILFLTLGEIDKS